MMLFHILNLYLRYVQPLPLAAKGDDPVGGTICINSGDDNDNYHHQYNDNDNSHAWFDDNYHDNDDDSDNFRGSHDMSHSQMLGKVEYGGGPIFKVVLEC